jgi:hypothetical protein
MVCAIEKAPKQNIIIKTSVDFFMFNRFKISNQLYYKNTLLFTNTFNYLQLFTKPCR